MLPIHPGSIIMQDSERFCLRWNDFQENRDAAFKLLRNNRDFADVTLACEDGTQFETHRVILASSSPFFMELLKKNKHPHPLMYMRGVRKEELVALMDFLYNGEANVLQDTFESFFVLAEELRLTGLTWTEKVGTTTNISPIKEIPETKKDHNNLFQNQKEENYFFSKEEKIDQSDAEESSYLLLPNRILAVAKQALNMEIQQLDSQVKS